MVRKPSRKALAFTAGAVVLGMAVALVLGECAVRFLDLAPGLNRVATDIHRLANDLVLKYEPVPWSYHGYEAINGQGRRDFHYPRAKGSDTFRIAAVGDSVTYGWGTNVWQSYPKVLEYFLNRYQTTAKKRFEVLNFGVRGYGIVEQTACLAGKVLAAEPDLILLGYNLNDPDPFSVDLAWIYSRMEWQDERFLQELSERSAARLWGALYQNSRLFRLVRYRYLAAFQQRHRKKAANKVGEALVDLEKRHNYQDQEQRYVYEITSAYWPRVKSSLAQISALSEKKRIPVVFVIFPLLDDLQSYRYLPIHERLARQAGQSGLHPVDLLPDFQQAAQRSPQESLAIDFDHPNARGHQLAAWAIGTKIIRAGVLPLGPADFQSAFFDVETSSIKPPLVAFEKQDMVQVEQGLNSLFFEEWETAADHLFRALALNPNNALARRLLKKVYADTDRSELKERIVKRLN